MSDDQLAGAGTPTEPRCQYCGADCSDGRSWDGGDLYACPPCAEHRAARGAGAVAPTDEGLYPVDARPSELLTRAIDAHRHTRSGGGDPGDLASFIARWLAGEGYVLRSTFPGPAALAARTPQPAASSPSVCYSDTVDDCACQPAVPEATEPPSVVEVPCDLLDSVVDPEPCWFDHHGDCQAHGYSMAPGEVCPMAQLKVLRAVPASRHPGVAAALGRADVGLLDTNRHGHPGVAALLARCDEIERRNPEIPQTLDVDEVRALLAGGGRP